MGLAHLADPGTLQGSSPGHGQVVSPLSGTRTGHPGTGVWPGCSSRLASGCAASYRGLSWCNSSPTGGRLCPGPTRLEPGTRSLRELLHSLASLGRAQPDGDDLHGPVPAAPGAHARSLSRCSSARWPVRLDLAKRTHKGVARRIDHHFLRGFVNAPGRQTERQRDDKRQRAHGGGN